MPAEKGETVIYYESGLCLCVLPDVPCDDPGEYTAFVGIKETCNEGKYAGVVAAAGFAFYDRKKSDGPLPVGATPENVRVKLLFNSPERLEAFVAQLGETVRILKEGLAEVERRKDEP